MEPSLGEVLLLEVFACIVFLTVIFTTTHFIDLVSNFGDSSAYMSIASAIRRWDFRGVVVKQFWGLPYLMAALSITTHISDRTALLLVSIASSLLAVLLVYRLWGAWVAGLFALFNFDWMQRTLLGGSEPLFMALLLGAFLAVRKERWLRAALLASLATTVRPTGLFALLAIGATLLWKRDFRTFAQATLIGLAVGAIYAWPLAHQFGNPLANLSSYHRDWDSAMPFTWPFHALLQDTGVQNAPWTNLALTLGWMLFVLASGIAMTTSKSFRAYARSHAVEVIFAAAYAIFLYTYNSSCWARADFPRFAIPVLPFVILAFRQWWPKDRRLLWGLGVLSPLLAASSAVGIRNIVHMLR